MLKQPDKQDGTYHAEYATTITSAMRSLFDFLNGRDVSLLSVGNTFALGLTWRWVDALAGDGYPLLGLRHHLSANRTTCFLR